MKKILTLLTLVLAINAANAQMKVGSSPTTISANSNLEVQATDGTLLHVNKDNGKVGIGTATPLEALDVRGKIFTQNAFNSSTTGALTYPSDSGRLFIGTMAGNTATGSSIVLRGTTNIAGGYTAGSISIRVPGDNGNAMVIKGDNGFVGIGTPTPTNNLDVLSTSNPARLRGLQSGAFSDSVLTADNNGVLRQLSMSSIGQASATLVEPWYNAATGSGATGNTQNIYQMGKIGIGTATPLEALDVRGKIFTQNAFNSSTTGALTYPSDSGRLFIGTQAGNTATGSSIILRGTTNVAGGYTAGSISLRVPGDNGNAMVVKGDNGFIGIGTPTPTNNLDILSTSNPLRLRGLQSGTVSDSVLTADINGVVRQLSMSSLGQASATLVEPWYDVATGSGANANTQDIYQMGKIGIGTSTPGQKLTIHNGNLQMQNYRSTIGSFGKIQFFNSAGYSTSERAYIESYRTASDDNGYLDFATAPSTNMAPQVRMTIHKNGNIGIGTTTPNSKLAVVGLPTYADNAAALAGGLAAGDFYRTSTGQVMVTY